MEKPVVEFRYYKKGVNAMKNIFLRTLSAILALTMLLSFAACGKEEPPVTEQPETGFSKVGFISTDVFKQGHDKNEKLVYEYSLPIIEFAGGDPGAAANMTRTFNERITQPAQEFIDSELIPYAEDPEYADLHSDTYSWYGQGISLVRSDEKLVCISAVAGSYFAGAAHGNSSCEILNFDPHTGEVVSLSDLGVDGADPTSDIVNLLAAKYIEQTPDTEYVGGLSGAVEIISEYIEGSTQSWKLTDRFTLVAEPYVLAPYAAGEQEVTLSAAELEGIVDAAWFSEPLPEPLTKVFADPEDIRPFDSVTVVGDYGYEMNLIWFDRDARDFTLYEIEYDENNEVELGSVIYEDYYMDQGKAVLLDMMIPEGIPNTGISVVIDGESYYWSIGYNGRDGGISFIEDELHRGG